MLKRLNGKVEVRGIDIVGYQSMTNYLVYLVWFFFQAPYCHVPSSGPSAIHR